MFKNRALRVTVDKIADPINSTTTTVENIDRIEAAVGRFILNVGVGVAGYVTLDTVRKVIVHKLTSK